MRRILLPKIVNIGGKQFLFDHDLFCVVQNDKVRLERLLEPELALGIVYSPVAELVCPIIHMINQVTAPFSIAKQTRPSKRIEWTP
jgi:hypothetical protein